MKSITDYIYSSACSLNEDYEGESKTMVTKAREEYLKLLKEMMKEDTDAYCEPVNNADLGITAIEIYVSHKKSEQLHGFTIRFKPRYEKKIVNNSYVHKPVGVAVSSNKIGAGESMFDDFEQDKNESIDNILSMFRFYHLENLIKDEFLKD